MGFFEAVKAAMGYLTTEQQSALLNESLDSFKTYLNDPAENPIIRMWVSDAEGYGHQSNTVNLLFQLTNSAENQGFGYSGTIEVYYLEFVKEPVLPKLFQLLPSLNNQAIGGTVNNANVNLIEWKETNPRPLPVVNLGFTGGEDDTYLGNVLTPPKLAANTNTNYFLRIEPYLWGSMELIQFLNTSIKSIDLTKESLLGRGAFKQRAFWEQIPVPVPNWDYYSQNGYSEQVEIIKSLVAKIDDYDLGVAYSIRTGSNYQLLDSPEDRMFEVITGYMASQMSGNAIRAGAKPIVVLSMDNFSNRIEDPHTRISQLMIGKMNSQESSWATDLAPPVTHVYQGVEYTRDPISEQRRNEIIQLLKAHTYRKSYLEKVKAGERITYLWNPTKVSVEAQYGFLNKKKNNVLFIQLGRIPAPMFNYLMDKAKMPAVFEGQNTGNLALQFGKPYFHVSRPRSTAVQYPTTILGYTLQNSVIDYNRYIPKVEYVPSVVSKMQEIANQINYPLFRWPSDSTKNPSEIIGKFIRNYDESDSGAYHSYYNAIRDFYQQPENDKFRIAASYFGYILKQKKAIQAPAPIAADFALTTTSDDTSSLSDLLANLYKNLDGSDLNMMPGVYAYGSIYKFISGILGVKVVLTNTTITPEEGTENPELITVTGDNSQLGGVPLSFVIEFTAPDGGVVSDWKMTYTGNWLTEEVPWLLFDKPYVSFQIADAVLPAQGSIGGIVQGLDLDLKINLPIVDGIWQIEGHFEEPASVSKFYQLAGGVNLVQALPSPFNALSLIGVTDCQMAYNSKENTVEYVSFVMSTPDEETVNLLPKLEMTNIKFNVLIQNPGSISERKTTWSIKGVFKMGKGDDAAIISAGMSYPGPIISAQLVKNVITVDSLFEIFLPGTKLIGTSSTPEVTEFIASFDGTTGNYSVVSKLNFDWEFVMFNGAPKITINEVGVQVQYESKKLEGGISGGIILGEGEGALSISLSANYKDDQWIFKGLQEEDTILSLATLANQFLPSDWKIEEYDYDLKNLSFSFEQEKKNFEVGGETDGYWTIPFIDLQIRADLQFGYGPAGGTSSSASDASSELVLLDSAEEDKSRGYYCKLNADIEWIGIKMNVFYNYQHGANEFGFTWGQLTGTIAQGVKDYPAKNWVGTLKFKDSVSLGSMIEEAISWATGYKYGLGSPWDLLNSLSLDKLELIYDFTAKTVEFKLEIAEINLGFCTVSGIGIEYLSAQKATKDKEARKSQVNLTIDGSFFWLIGDDDSSSDQLKWDATDPAATPAPSGQGNKYFDLRLLALGQHVTIPGITEVQSVQDAIKLMRDLPPTEAGEIPNITFYPNSSWLVGMDFGILKLDKKKAKEGENAESDGSDYFIDLQIVFNDPYLYGLRIALSGEPARMFKGLDFQILYRKISDSVGVYQSEIALPDIMRKIQLGQVNITLPVIAVEIYTNGDFLIDLGFPKNADFSRSFTLQTIIYVPFPIPIMGSAGLYFGKKSSETSKEVPTIDNGTFNPVIVFGIGIQFGLGYDFNSGILAAGFSLTVVTIIEGVIAKFNPYQIEDNSTGEQSDIGPSYYYKVKGVVGIQGKLFGYVDFKIIKAEINVFLSVLADITIAAYSPILLGITVEVSVSVSIKISLGFFSIKISFSFKMKIRESFEIQTGGGQAPWHIAASTNPETALLKTMQNNALLSTKYRSLAFLAVVEDDFVDLPTWNNLTASTPEQLKAYIGFGLSMAGDKADKNLAAQKAVYSAMLFIESMPSTNDDPNSPASKAYGTEKDTSFEILSKQIFRWVIAAFHNGSISAENVDKLVISRDRLQEIFGYLNNASDTNPMPFEDIDQFMSNQVNMTVSHPSETNDTADATYFPIVPQLNMTLPAFDGQAALDYAFAGYNSLSETYIKDLITYFDDLTVKMQNDQPHDDAQNQIELINDPESLATFIYSDYFLLLARQMVQNAQEALSTFHFHMEDGQNASDVVTIINQNGQFNESNSIYKYTANDLFEDNKTHVLSTASAIKIGESTYSVVGADTFTSISSKDIYNTGFSPSDLATLNSDNTTILQDGVVVDYPDKISVLVQSGNSLASVAVGFTVTLAELLANSNVLTKEGLIMPSSTIKVPAFTGSSKEKDDLVTFSARYGVSIESLTKESTNLSLPNLFDIQDNEGQLIISHLPQYEVGELIKEIQANKGLQQLSGMSSRYYLSGLRLPTKGITPKYQGMWIDNTMKFEQLNAGLFSLTGQQFPLPVLPASESYTISFKIPSNLTWMKFDVPEKSETLVDSIDIKITEASSTYKQINTVRNYAQNNYLDLDIETLGLGDMFDSSNGHYTFGEVCVWKAGSKILLPNDGVINDAQTLNIWTLPSNLMDLADPTGRLIRPRFKVKTGTVDPVTQAMKSNPVSNYAWGTKVSFNVKKIPVSTDSPASLTTYEITGADGNNALLLEKMVTYLGTDDSLIDLISFGFAQNQSSGSNPGIQTDPIADLTIGIAQANMSTFTRPPADASFANLNFAEAEVVSEKSNLLNKETDLIKLLWQASITRDGGYYLYYYNSENGEGIPEHAFNDKGEASLSLVVLYANSPNDDLHNLLQPYMNMFVTGDPINGSNSTIFAESEPISTTVEFKENYSLESIGFKYFTNIGDIVESNEAAPLTAGIIIDVPEGVYQVKDAAGETLESIAVKFKTDVDAIKAANPLEHEWPVTLPQYSGVRLPAIKVTVSADDPNSKTFSTIADFYGMDLTALANYNRATKGIIVTDTPLTMVGGPTQRVATVPAGVVSLEAIRKEPLEIPASPSDANYSKIFLQHDFSILTFELTDNSWFNASKPSLPAGPTDPDNGVVLTDKWMFKQSVPYSKFAKLPAQSKEALELPTIETSPYKGIGYLVQPDFTWLDLYGNKIMTTLSQSTSAPGSVINETPILTGYTDALLSINQWPSVSSSWQIGTDSNDENQVQIQIPLTFDTSAYNGLLKVTTLDTKTLSLVFTEDLDATSAQVLTNYKLTDDQNSKFIISSAVQSGKTVTLTTEAELSDKPIYSLAIGNIQNLAKTTTFSGQASFSFSDNPLDSSSSIVQQATSDFQVYTQLWYQLNDPNGIEMSIETSLYKDPFKVEKDAFDDLLNKWIAKIYLFLQDRSTGGTTILPPNAEYDLSFNIDPSTVKKDQIIELILSFIITRTGGAIMGDFETTGGIKKVATLLSPSTNSAVSSTKGLDDFADAFEDKMSVPGEYYLKISTGADRDKLGQQKPDGTIWAVRLGIDFTEPIAYDILHPGEPILFAPKPVSNKLESRTGINIYNYTSGTGISPTADYQKDFTEIDLDQWVSAFFGSIDEILTPEFTAAIQLVDKKVGAEYLQTIQQNKEDLADIGKKLMIPVYQGEAADATGVQEALKQALLAKLSNLYATNSGIVFDAGVKADASTGAPPNLFGSLIQNTVFEGVISNKESLTTVILFFSAALDTASAELVTNYSLSDSIEVKSAAYDEAKQSVTLKTSGDVVLDATTVTIKNTLIDANKREVQGDKEQTIVTDFASYYKTDQLTITSAKIKLDESSSQSLAFLLSSPETVRGVDGEVLSKIDLNLSYKATDIEHQISQKINGFTPSSWLSFVVPKKRVPLESALGDFAVPMFLRSFPENPALVNQSGAATFPNNADFSKLMSWDYTFNYSQSYHYPQDTLNFTLNFNVGQSESKSLFSIKDAFAELAEFITVYPSVEVDLKTVLTKIDAKQFDENSPESEKLFANSSIALKSFVKLVTDIVNGASNGLEMQSSPKSFVSNGTNVELYAFELREGAKSYTYQGEILPVQVVSIIGRSQPTIGTPKVYIDPDKYEMKTWTSPNKLLDEIISYYYIEISSGKPLLSIDAQKIQPRQVIIPDLNVLRYQDVMTTVMLTRNAGLIPGKMINRDFVYNTGEIAFSNAYLPTLTSITPLEIATLPGGTTPSKRPLLSQLQELMKAVLEDNHEPTISIQMTCSYDYTMNVKLSPFNLPVIMQTMISVNLDTELNPMLQNWTDSINNWFANTQPNKSNGVLRFEMTLFSNLTQQPFPLLILNNLLLNLKYVE